MELFSFPQWHHSTNRYAQKDVLFVKKSRDDPFPRSNLCTASGPLISACSTTYKVNERCLRHSTATIFVPQTASCFCQLQVLLISLNMFIFLCKKFRDLYQICLFSIQLWEGPQLVPSFHQVSIVSRIESLNYIWKEWYLSLVQAPALCQQDPIPANSQALII